MAMEISIKAVGKLISVGEREPIIMLKEICIYFNVFYN